MIVVVLPRIAAAFAVAVGVLVLVGGWVLDVQALRSIVPDTVGMKASTAGMFVLAGCSLALLVGTASRTARAVAAVLALGCIGLSAAFLAEYLGGWTLGIDELPFRDAVGHAAGIAYPGRPAHTTAACFVLVGTALLTLRVRHWICAAPIAPVAAVAALYLIGYAYDIPAFHGPASAAKMALNTAAALLVLSAGIALARPSSRLRALMTTEDPGGVMARRLIPLAVGVPFLLGWLRLAGQDAGWYGLRVGTWLLTFATIVCLLGVIAEAGLMLSRSDRRRRELEVHLEHLASHDPLTGIFNRRQLELDVATHVALGRRHGTSGTLLALDLDRFKVVNDSLGHAAGDALLCMVADTLRGRLRDTDILGRLGGDEFAVYLPHTGPADAQPVADDLRELIRRGSHELQRGCHTTVSIGVAGNAHHPDAAATFAAADAAMYEAKRAGGDRVSLAAPLSLAS